MATSTLFLFTPRGVGSFKEPAPSSFSTRQSNPSRAILDDAQAGGCTRTPLHVESRPRKALCATTVGKMPCYCSRRVAIRQRLVCPDCSLWQGDDEMPKRVPCWDGSSNAEPVATGTVQGEVRARGFSVGGEALRYADPNLKSLAQSNTS
jgi:hypothetical protein